MRGGRPAWRAAVALTICTVLGVLVGCDGAAPPSTSDADPSVSEGPTTAGTPTEPTNEPTNEPTEEPTTRPASPSPEGLVYYAGRRAHTGELLLFAEPSGLTGRQDLLAAVRAAMAGPPLDPDYTSLWGDDVVASVRLLWDGDEGNYVVRLVDDRATERRPGTSMREAHLAIQQVVWTLHSVGRVRAPVQFRVGRSPEPVTDLLGLPATGPYDTYPAADHSGVLSRINVLTPDDGATVAGEVEVSGLAESFEATVALRVVGPDGDVVLDDSTTAEQCCGRLFPWTATLDTSRWPPGTYVISALTDDPVGRAQGSDGPEIDTKTVTVDRP